MKLKQWLATCLVAPCLMVSATDLSIFEASIEQLQTALSTGQINAVQLVAKHLHRISHYDRRGPRLDAIPVLNPLVFAHAQASDSYRAASNGSIRSNLEGIPCTLKDSYMMAGMTVSAGSPAFENLTASTDAFTVGKIRDGGGIVLGLTNMPPMANGGMQRGLYGRAESPYNGDYLAAAYASGSSNGAGSSTAASMGVFAMGEETVSSGRSPASNNGLVAYTPSRGVISIRGNWPLFPVADVVVPYARSVGDMFSILNVIVAEDQDKTADFWRGQPFVALPSVEDVRPRGSYHTLVNSSALSGKRIGVPKMYIGESDPQAQPIWVSPAVRKLWEQARATLESLGAIVEEVGFPLVTNYETAPETVDWDTDYPLPATTDDPDLAGPGELWSYGWDDFLHYVNDTDTVARLADVDPNLIFPQLPNTLPDRYGNQFGNRSVSNTGIVEGVTSRNGTSIFSLPGLEKHLKALEARRERDLEAWMDDQGLDALVWPSAGDVGRADAETNDTSAVHAWRNGVFFSNGNYAIRRFGVPTVSVSMGMLEDIDMPMGLTFASRAYDDNALLSYGFAFEKAHGKRASPPRTPELDSDAIPRRCARSVAGTKPPRLTAAASKLSGNIVEVSGTVEGDDAGGIDSVEVFVDGVSAGHVVVVNGEWSVLSEITPYDDSLGEVPVRFVNEPDQTLAMIVAFKVFDRHGSAVIVKSPDYPPESQAHEYYPCGKPSVSVEVLRYFYCNPSRIRDVRENFLDKIPNKLHRILLSDPDCKVLGPDCARNGWGIRVTEDPDWKLLALGALASPMLILVVLYSTTRGFLLVTVCVGTVVCLFSTSLRDLVRVLQLRDQQHRDGPMRITQAAQQQAEGSEGSGKGSGSESSSEKDIEAGTTKPSGKERSCISQFLYPSMRKGKDDEDGELKRHRRPMEDPELDGLLQLCVYNSSDGLPELRQEPVARFSSDYEFFIWLKRLCGRPSPWSWRGFLTRCGLRTVIGINYCKIELHPNDRASIDDEPSYPPYALRSSYQPTQAGDDDSSAPNTSSQGFSWFNPGVLADFYHNPSRLWKEHGTGANRFYVLKRFVRKLDGHLLYNGSGSLGYAMEVQEGPDLFRVMVLQTAMMFVAIIVGIICGVATGDVQNGCAIAACLAFLFKGIIQLLEKS
ncbi:putative amidase protein [Colletotrichum karsti]|uniref:Amidase protein n=1 Tax=Colletotrichum karsti TaxID=1095194 RepID=A0A9P6LI83_9PEZI|nr:putative amidase protein [Colletotrichum karsti]KAF9873332.1 putative amidase protein [Colletotrichum karsti]